MSHYPDRPADAGTADPLDLLGVGFGPAALAVATAIEDDAEASRTAGGDRRPVSAGFLEQAPDAAWQPSMLLDGTDIQHHFLRDLATPRNPRSRFTFPSYLVDTDRLYPFTLMGGYVSRHEWSAYLVWAAGLISLPVRYDTRVVEALPVLRDGRVVAARVRGVDTRTGGEVEALTRNLLVSTGSEPYVPEPFPALVGERLFHSADFLPRMRALPVQQVRQVAVIGAGQNAGEALLHVAAALPGAEVHSLVRNSGFQLYNLGHFSNEAYFPTETDYFYGLPADRRRAVLDELRATNYASVDPDLSTALYRLVYEDRHWGRRRMHMHRRTAVTACAPTPGGGYRLGLRELNTGATDELDVDVVVLCTGFREPRVPALLDAFADHLELELSGEPVVSREFRLGTAPGCEVGIYLNGITEWRHGINSAASFSTTALRAEAILRDLRQRLDAPARPVGQDARVSPAHP